MSAPAALQWGGGEALPAGPWPRRQLSVAAAARERRGRRKRRTRARENAYVLFPREKSSGTRVAVRYETLRVGEHLLRKSSRNSFNSRVVAGRPSASSSSSFPTGWSSRSPPRSKRRSTWRRPSRPHSRPASSRSAERSRRIRQSSSRTISWRTTGGRREVSSHWDTGTL